MFHPRLAVLLVAASLLAPGHAPWAVAQGHDAVSLGPPTASVVGFAWAASDEPLANVAVRLRNLLSGAVDARNRTNGAGEFRFENVQAGTYVIEIVNDRGGVVAVGAPFTLTTGATVATFVRLAQPAAWFPAALTNTAAAVVLAAASLGIVAVQPPAQSASADR